MAPIAGTQDDGDNSCFVSVVALEGALHLDSVAVVGSQEVWANE